MNDKGLNTYWDEELDLTLQSPSSKRTELIESEAKLGLPAAQTLYGQMLLEGIELRQDEEAAARWFWAAATRGDLMAINMLGWCYENGRGVKTDITRASEWYRVAAERGLDWAIVNFAYLMAVGRGVPQDKAQAGNLLDGIVNRASSLGVINYIGRLHETGRISDRNPLEASRLYSVAANAGHPRSMFDFARMLLADGEEEQALGWMQRAHAKGDEPLRSCAKSWLQRLGWRFEQCWLRSPRQSFEISRPSFLLWEGCISELPKGRNWMVP